MKANPDQQELIALLNNPNPEHLEKLVRQAEETRLRVLGNSVYLRGLIEFSNRCQCDCYYCGLRRTLSLNRYRLSRAEIVSLALKAFARGYHSLALQSGEVSTQSQVDFVADIIKEIKDHTSREIPGGLGITLSIGELSYKQYQQLFAAGAHRYLLRIETSDEELFRAIHPPQQSLQRRLRCLEYLKEIGYQVGTGIMVGLPGQTVAHLAQDLLLFVEHDIDMLGLGPYIPHPATPLPGNIPAELDRYHLTLKMMALARLLMPDINMVASTALQTIHPRGLQMGIRAGANVLMPVMTPAEHREDYTLYANKKYESLEGMRQEAEACGYNLVFWHWGDSPHYYRRQGKTYPIGPHF